jgi:hypothetical protein
MGGRFADPHRFLFDSALTAHYFAVVRVLTPNRGSVDQFLFPALPIKGRERVVCAICPLSENGDWQVALPPRAATMNRLPAI